MILRETYPTGRIDPVSEQWFRLLSPERLAIDIENCKIRERERLRLRQERQRRAVGESEESKGAPRSSTDTDAVAAAASRRRRARARASREESIWESSFRFGSGGQFEGTDDDDDGEEEEGGDNYADGSNGSGNRFGSSRSVYAMSRYRGSVLGDAGFAAGSTVNSGARVSSTRLGGCC